MRFYNKQYFDELCIKHPYKYIIKNTLENYVCINDSSNIFEKYCCFLYYSLEGHRYILSDKKVLNNNVKIKYNNDYELQEYVPNCEINKKKKYWYYGKYIKIGDYINLCKQYKKTIVDDLLFDITKDDIEISKKEITNKVKTILNS